MQTHEIIDRVFERTDDGGDPIVRLGIWPMIEAELESLLDAPLSLDMYTNDRRQGDAVRSAVPKALLPALETIAALANVNDTISKKAKNYATDVVVEFAGRYLSKESAAYSESSVRLMWDVYRNGALHRYWPKTCEALDPASRTANVGFDFRWKEAALQDLRSEEITALDPPQLRLKELPFSGPDHSFFEIVLWPQILFLELRRAVASWEDDVRCARVPQTWIEVGFAELRRTNRVKPSGLNTSAVESMVQHWRTSNAPAPPIAE